MKVRILGCSGGIGGRNLRTTSMFIDEDILVDAGTGVGELSIDELRKIDHLFLTHTHLDHIACLPLIVDTVGDLRDKPMVVHATEEVIGILKDHVFNWKIWPDFSQIPSTDKPFLRFQALQIGRAVKIGQRSFTAMPASHTVPAVGYLIDSGTASLAFSGDTAACPEQWSAINAANNLRVLIYECAFSNKEAALAEASKHLCPATLSEQLRNLRIKTELFITHLKPGESEQTMLEIENSIGEFNPKMLQNNHVFEL